MNVIKNLVVLSGVLCAGAVGLTPGEAVGGSTTLGAHCSAYSYQLATPPTLQRFTDGTFHGIYAEDAQILGLTCPVAIETTLGATVNFRVRVNDYNTTHNLTCYGSVYNQNGGVVVSTAAMNSTGSAGGQTLTASVAVSPQSSSYTYGVNCAVPGGQFNGIVAVRVY